MPVGVVLVWHMYQNELRLLSTGCAGCQAGQATYAAACIPVPAQAVGTFQVLTHVGVIGVV